MSSSATIAAELATPGISAAVHPLCEHEILPGPEGARLRARSRRKSDRCNSAIQTAAKRIEFLWQRHDELDALDTAGGLTPAQRLDLQSVIEERERLEHQILTARPASLRDAACLAILVAAYVDSTQRRDQEAQQAGMEGLADYLVGLAGTDTKGLGLGDYS